MSGINEAAPLGYYPLLNMAKYSEAVSNVKISVNNVPDGHLRQIAALNEVGNSGEFIDTGLELALARSFIVSSMPAEVSADFLQKVFGGADIYHPYADKKQEMLTLGAAVYGEMLVLRPWGWTERLFGKDAQVKRYEEMLNTICKEGGINKKDIEKYYEEALPGEVYQRIYENFCISHFSIGGRPVILTFQPDNNAIKLLYGDSGYVDGNTDNLGDFWLELARKDQNLFSSAALLQIDAELSKIPAFNYVQNCPKKNAQTVEVLAKLEKTLTAFLLKPSDARQADLIKLRLEMNRYFPDEINGLDKDLQTAFLPALRSLNSVMAHRYAHLAANRSAVMSLD